MVESHISSISISHISLFPSPGPNEAWPWASASVSTPELWFLEPGWIDNCWVNSIWKPEKTWNPHWYIYIFIYLHIIYIYSFVSCSSFCIISFYVFLSHLFFGGRPSMDLRTLRKPFRKVSRVWARSELSRLSHIVYISSQSLVGKYWGPQRSPWKACFSCTIMWVWGPHLSNAQMSRCCDWLMKNGGFRSHGTPNYPSHGWSYWNLWSRESPAFAMSQSSGGSWNIGRTVCQRRSPRDLVFTLDLAGDVPNLHCLVGSWGISWISGTGSEICLLLTSVWGLKHSGRTAGRAEANGSMIWAISDEGDSLQVATASGSSGRPKKHKHIHVFNPWRIWWDTLW